MVRTTLGAEVETNVTVAGSESVDFLSVDQSTDVADGTNDVVIVRPPSGFLYELVSLGMLVRSTGGTGEHRLIVQSEAQRVTILRGVSDGTTTIRYQGGTFSSANIEAIPSSSGQGSQQVRGARIDSGNGLAFEYQNRSGATQTDNRRLRLWVRKIQVE